jgi:membrane-associated protease RseP (regulator of RpoE activity)
MCLALTAAVTVPALAEDKEKDEAALEAQLEAAREKLEDAAREVAELSSQLTGPVMEDFIIARPGMSQRAMLGISIGEAEDAKGGVHVDGVTPGGPASEAGLKAGDVIVSIDGKNLRNTDKSSDAALVAHMRTLKPGDKVKVEYLRDGKSHSAEVTTEGMDRAHFMAALPALRPMMGVAPVPGVPGEPFTMGFRAFPGAHFLDMELVTLTPKLGRYFGTDKGVLVVKGPRSGEFKLEEGDVIVDIDGRTPQNGAHALRILRSYQPGEKLTLNILRDRKPVKLAATMPKDAGGDGDALFFNEGFFNEPVEPVPFTRPLPPRDGGPT